MVTKRILVLANSIKRQRRCVAGCELIDEGAGKFGSGRFQITTKARWTLSSAGWRTAKIQNRWM
jgi:hypothetical protein